jgi:hypothetical protein
MPQKLHAEAKALVESIERFVVLRARLANTTIDPSSLDELQRDLVVRLSRLYERIEQLEQRKRQSETGK